MFYSGKIAKLSKGRYYKQEITVFGNLQPKQYQIVKDLLEKDGKTVGYITGFSIYNSLGLSTQVSNAIQIGKKTVRPSFKRERYTISFVLQKNTINDENIPLLQILDAIRYIKKIPDTTPSSACERLLGIIKGLNDKNKSNLVRLSLKYPPVTRALLGALLENLGFENLTEPIKKSLNPITTYNLSGVSQTLQFTEKWNIK